MGSYSRPQVRRAPHTRREQRSERGEERNRAVQSEERNHAVQTTPLCRTTSLAHTLFVVCGQGRSRPVLTLSSLSLCCEPMNPQTYSRSLTHAHLLTLTYSRSLTHAHLLTLPSLSLRYKTVTVTGEGLTDLSPTYLLRQPGSAGVARGRSPERDLVL